MSDNVTISKITDTITISVVSTGQVNTGQNLGAGAGVFKEKVGADFRYRTLTQGNGISITENSNTVEVALDTADNVTFNNLTINNLTVNGTINSDLIPDGDETRDLGSAAAKWNDLYLSGNTITLGTATISSTAGAINLPAGSTIGGDTIAIGPIGDSDDVPEGSTNLYHTTARARAAISATDAGGDGSLAYNNTTGVITYTGPSAADVRAHFTAGTGISITSGAIASTITQFTTANARSAISVTDAGGEGSLSYNSSTGVITYTGPSHSGFEVTSAKNAVNGYAGLDATGKVASAQLPSYVDDVVEAANQAALPVTGETSKIYVTLDTNKTYRWSGSAYVEISASPGSTDSVTEGSTNLYFTTQRARDAFSASTGITITNGAIATTITQYTDAGARAAISVTDAGGDGSMSYNSSTGVITYTGPSASETRAHFTAGTGISITSGAIASTVTDTNTTYAISAESGTPTGANLRLTAGGSGSGTDDVKFANGTNIAVTRTDANTITIGTTGLAAVATTGAYSDLTGLPTVPAVLDDLGNVNAGSPTDGQVLTWDSGPNEWIPSSPTADRLTNGAHELVLESTGTVTLPNGGTITEAIVTSNPTIQLTPADPDVASQKLVIKGGGAFDVTDNGININYYYNTAVVDDNLTFYVYSPTYADTTLYWWIYPTGAAIGTPNSGTVVLTGSSGNFSFVVDNDSYEFTVRVSPEEDNYDPASIGVETLLINAAEPTFEGEHHLHLTTGDLTETSIFLGTDNHNVRTMVDGSIQITTPDTVNNVWNFGVDGATTFPTLTVPINDNASPVGTGQTIKFSDTTQQAIIFGPASTSVANSAQRIIIQGAPGYTGTSGEGGDVYLWAGPGGSTDGNGGDIKVRAGLGDGTGNGGYLNFQSGDSDTGSGGYINIETGSSNTYGSGGDITVHARSGGEITLRTRLSDGTSKDWLFNNAGDLTLPVGGDIKDSTGTSVLGAAGFDQTLNTTDSVVFNGVVSTVDGYEAFTAKRVMPAADLTDADGTALIGFSVTDQNDVTAFVGAVSGNYDSTVGNRLFLSVYNDGVTTYTESYPLGVASDRIEFLDSSIVLSLEGGDNRLYTDNNIVIESGTDALIKLNSGNSLELEVTTDLVTVHHDLQINGNAAFSINQLNDVDTSAPSDGDVLTWDDATSSWIPAAPAGGGSIFGDYNDDNTDYPTVENSPSSYTHYLDIGTDNAYELNMNTDTFTLRLGNSTQTTYKAPRTVWLVLRDVYSLGNVNFSLNEDNSTALAGTVILRSGGSFPSTQNISAGSAATYIMLMSPDNYNWFWFMSDLT